MALGTLRAAHATQCQMRDLRQQHPRYHLYALIHLELAAEGCVSKYVLLESQARMGRPGARRMTSHAVSPQWQCTPSHKYVLPCLLLTSLRSVNTMPPQGTFCIIESRDAVQVRVGAFVDFPECDVRGH